MILLCGFGSNRFSLKHHTSSDTDYVETDWFSLKARKFEMMVCSFGRLVIKFLFQGCLTAKAGTTQNKELEKRGQPIVPQIQKLFAHPSFGSCTFGHKHTFWNIGRSKGKLGVELRFKVFAGNVAGC